MANRVLLSAGGLKVSKPGFNVLTASPEDLALDTNKGLFTWHTAVYSRPAGSGTVYQDLSYPALSYTPCFNYQWYDGTSWQQGRTSLGFPHVHLMTSSTFRITWYVGMNNVRVNIYAIQGQS